MYIYIYIYIYIIYCANPKKLFLSCHYHIWFVCLAAMVFKVSNANKLQHCSKILQYTSVHLDVQIKYS